MNILVAEENKNSRTWIRRLLKQRGYAVVEAADETKAKERIKENPNDTLVITRLGWLDDDRQTNIPVLYLTDKLQIQKLQGRTSDGCVDYLCEPFEPRILFQKVQALIDRHERYRIDYSSKNHIFYASDLTIDPYQCLVMKKGETIHLTGKEFSLLLFLVEHRGTTWKTKELYERVWHETYLPSSSNTVMVHMQRLRSKIEDNPAEPKIIRTLYGRGYQVD